MCRAPVKPSLLVALAAWPALAWGHAGQALDAIDVVTLPGDARLDLELSVGLVLLEGPEPRWVCHEVVTTPGAEQSPRFARGREGTWIGFLRDPAQARDGIASWSSADGCDWAPADGLDGDGVLAVAFDPMRRGHALAVARRSTGETRLLETEDHGARWDPVEALAGAGAVHGVVFGFEGTAWVGATTDETRVWTGSPGGAWNPGASPGVGADPMWVVAVDALDPRRALAVHDPPERDALWATADGASWERLAGPTGEVVDGAPDGAGDTWVILDGDRLARVGAGIELEARGVGVGFAAGTAWYTPHPLDTGWLLERLAPDGQREGAWTPADIAGPLVCPDDSDVARTCAPLWEELGPRLAGIDGEPPRPEDTGSPGAAAEPNLELASRCGCASLARRTAPGGVAWAWALAGVLLCRRR